MNSENPQSDSKFIGAPIVATIKGPIVFFDGVCNLCDSAVQFIIKHDKKGHK